MWCKQVSKIISIRGLNKGGGAIGPPYFVRIEGATKQQRCAALLVAPQFLEATEAPEHHQFLLCIASAGRSRNDNSFSPTVSVSRFLFNGCIFISSGKQTDTWLVQNKQKKTKTSPLIRNYFWCNWKNFLKICSQLPQAIIPDFFS